MDDSGPGHSLSCYRADLESFGKAGQIAQSGSLKDVQLGNARTEKIARPGLPRVDRPKQRRNSLRIARQGEFGTRLHVGGELFALPAPDHIENERAHYAEFAVPAHTNAAS